MIRTNDSQNKTTWQFTITDAEKRPLYHECGYPSLYAANYVALCVMRKAYPGHRIEIKRETV